MYCGKCGQKLENNAKFCPNCGNQIKAEYRDTIYKADREVRKNKVKWPFILAACILCLTGGVIMGSLIIFGPVGNRTENGLSSDRQQETAVDESDMNAESGIAAKKDTELEQYMEEGQACLEAQDYLGALTAFKKATELDEQSVEAWQKRAQVYEEQEYWVGAFRVLALAYEETGDKQFMDKIKHEYLAVEPNYAPGQYDESMDLEFTSRVGEVYVTYTGEDPLKDGGLNHGAVFPTTLRAGRTYQVKAAAYLGGIRGEIFEGTYEIADAREPMSFTRESGSDEINVVNSNFDVISSFMVSKILAHGSSDVTIGPIGDDGMAVISAENGTKVGLADIYGNVVTGFVYDDIESYSYYLKAKNGRAVIKDGMRGFVNQNGEEIIPPLYDELWEEHTDAGPVFRAEKDGLYGCIDTAGNVILPVEYTEIEIDSQGVYMEQNGQWGYVSLTDDYTIPCEYADLLSVDRDRDYILAKKDGSWGILNTQREIVKPFVYSEITEKWMSDGSILAAVRADGTGSEVLMAKENGLTMLFTTETAYDEFWVYGNDVYSSRSSVNDPWIIDWVVHAHEENEKHYFVKPDGRILDEAGYDSVSHYRDGLFIVSQNGQELLIDTHTDHVVGKAFDQIFSVLPGHPLVVEKEGRRGVIDEMGEVLIPAEYDSSGGGLYTSEVIICGGGRNWKCISWITGEVIKEVTLDSEYKWVYTLDDSDPENSSWLCYSDEAVSIVDMDGNVRRYDEAWDLGGGWQCVYSGELRGAVNPEGVEVIPVMYKQISKVDNRLIGWRNDDSDVDYYDEDGNLLFSADQMSSSWKNNGKRYFQVKNDGIWEIVDENGRTVTSKKYQLMTRF